MRACVFATLANAATFVTTLNTVLGYPKNGVNVGGGIHAPAASSRTVRWAVPFRHVTDSTRWAVVFRDRLMLLTTAAAEARIVTGVVTAPTAAELAPSSLTQAQYDALRAKLLTSVELTADWFE